MPMYSDVYYNYNDNNTRLEQSDLKLRGASPTVHLRDTDHNVSFLHCNSNLFYILRGATDATTWTQVSGAWPMTVNLTNNNVEVGGNFTAVGSVTQNASDRRLKTNLRVIDNAVDKVKSLTGYNFDWLDDVSEKGFYPDHAKNDTGLIAQDVEKVVPQAVYPAPFDSLFNTEEGEPDLVSKSGENYLTVQYDKLVPLLVESIKELSENINNLEQQIAELKKSSS